MSNELQNMSKILSGTLEKLGLPVENQNQNGNELTNEKRRASAVNSIGNVLADYYKRLFQYRQNMDTNKIKETTNTIKHIKELINNRIRGIVLLIDPLENKKLYGAVRIALIQKIEEIENREPSTDLEKFVYGNVKMDFEEMINTLDEVKESAYKKPEQDKEAGKIIQLPTSKTRSSSRGEDGKIVQMPIRPQKAGPYRPNGADWQNRIDPDNPNTFDTQGFFQRDPDNGEER